MRRGNKIEPAIAEGMMASDIAPPVEKGRRAIFFGLAIALAGMFRVERCAALFLQSLGDPHFDERLARNTELLRPPI